MTMHLAGDASTQSRGRRPLPEHVQRAVTLNSIGVRETVVFSHTEGGIYPLPETRELVSWVVGQHGCLWGSRPEFLDPWRVLETPGSYGHQNEEDLAYELGRVFAGRLSHPAMACRFFSNGGDAMSAAARLARATDISVIQARSTANQLARAITGREPIASYGYHGAHLDYVHAPNVVGVPEGAVDLHQRFEFGDAVTMEDLAKTCAAIIVEVPPVADNVARAFLQACRAACDKHGAVFIIDDVVLGFRLALAGSAEYYGVKPDMVVLGKAMCAIGLVSAVVGRADMVDLLGTRVFYSTTFGGHPGLMYAATETLKRLQRNQHNIYGEQGRLNEIGRALMDGLNEIGQGRYRVEGQPVRSVAVFETEDERRAWCSAMIARGFVVDRPFFPTLVHTLEDVARTLEAARTLGDLAIG